MTPTRPSRRSGERNERRTSTSSIRSFACATWGRRTPTTTTPRRARDGVATRWTPPPREAIPSGRRPRPSAARSSGESEMTARRRLVKVPASSANLGPGYDVLAAALAMHLELEVEETGTFSVEAKGLQVPLDRSNLCVRAFEALRPADGIAFRIGSEIPLAAGLGSSAAAIVAGLLAADHLYELALEPEDILVKAAELEGHPDNVAASLYGAFVVCAIEGGAVTATRLDPPQGVEGVVVVPKEQVPTEEARRAIPDEVPLTDAIANISAAAELVLGIQRSDLTLIGRGLSDRLHQPRRAHLY